MDVAEALQVLGLKQTNDWPAVRAAYLAAIVAAHPDNGGSTHIAAHVNRAFDVLSAATDSGLRGFPATVEQMPRPQPEPEVRLSAREREPEALLMRIADAAHEIGEVVFIDPQAGLLEVIVGSEPGVGQLTAAVGDVPESDDTSGIGIAFTLEPLGVAPAPSIEGIVDQLMIQAGLRAG